MLYHDVEHTMLVTTVGQQILEASKKVVFHHVIGCIILWLCCVTTLGMYVVFAGVIVMADMQRAWEMRRWNCLLVAPMPR